MSENPNERQEPGGLGIAVRVILAVVVLAIAVGALLLVLELVSLGFFQLLVTRAALIGGIALLVSLALGLLGGTKR